MKPSPITAAPSDAAARKAVKPVVCYPVESLPRPDLAAYRALRDDLDHVETVVVPPREAEGYVHDVLNVFMCTGFTRDTGQYFMKASPVRPGDYLEFFAEIDLLGCMSACPGGDCSSEHSSDTAKCHPMVVEVYKARGLPKGWAPPPVNGYDGTHGL